MPPFVGVRARSGLEPDLIAICVEAFDFQVFGRRSSHWKPICIAMLHSDSNFATSLRFRLA